jgi:hypothetical protein
VRKQGNRLYRLWPAGLTLAGKRPELTAAQVHAMSMAAIAAYHRGDEAAVPLIETR